MIWVQKLFGILNKLVIDLQERSPIETNERYKCQFSDMHVIQYHL